MDYWGPKSMLPPRLIKLLGGGGGGAAPLPLPSPMLPSVSTCKLLILVPGRSAIGRAPDL